MLTIKGKQINITRGDVATIKLKLKLESGYYTFKSGDYLEFKVYNKKGYEEEPVLYKKVEINEETEIAEIDLTSEDTRIGEIINKKKEYWYEVQLNGNITVIGYSEEKGPSIFMLLPEGSEIEGSESE